MCKILHTVYKVIVVSDKCLKVNAALGPGMVYYRHLSLHPKVDVMYYILSDAALRAETLHFTSRLSQHQQYYIQNGANLGS